MSGGFLLLAAFLFYLDTDGLLLWSGAACALHELGHYLVIRLCGGGVRALRLSCVGAEMVLSPRRPLSRPGLILSALAGPAVNLLLALASARLAHRWGGEGLYLFAGVNLALAAFNLLPVAQLDGGRFLRGIFGLFRPEEEAGRFMELCSLAVSSALVLGGGILVLQGRASITLLVTALWLFAASAAGGEKKLVLS